MISRLTLVALLVAASITHAADPDKRWHGILPEDAPGFDPSGSTNTSAAAVVNLKTAKALGLTIPQSVPASAHEVIR